MCKFAQKCNFFLKHEFLQKLNDLENLIFFFMVTKKNEMFKIVQFLKKIVFQKKVEILGNFGKSLSFFRGLLSSSAWTLRPIPCVAVQGRCRPDAEACDCEKLHHRKRVLGVAKRPRESHSAKPRRQNSYFLRKFTKP